MGCQNPKGLPDTLYESDIPKKGGSIHKNGIRASYISNVSLPELVEEDVELELGAEVAESAVAEGLEWPVGDEGAQQVDVGHEGLQVGVLVGHRLTGLQVKGG